MLLPSRVSSLALARVATRDTSCAVETEPPRDTQRSIYSVGATLPAPGCCCETCLRGQRCPSKARQLKRLDFCFRGTSSRTADMPEMAAYDPVEDMWEIRYSPTLRAVTFYIGALSTFPNLPRRGG